MTFSSDIAASEFAFDCIMCIIGIINRFLRPEALLSNTFGLKIDLPIPSVTRCKTRVEKNGKCVRDHKRQLLTFLLKIYQIHLR